MNLQEIQRSLSDLPPWAETTIALAGLILAALVANALMRRLTMMLAHRLMDGAPVAGGNRLASAVSRLSTIVPVLIIGRGIVLVPNLGDGFIALIQNLASAVLVLSVVLAISAALDFLNALYNVRPHAANRPIKGYIQVIKILLFGAATLLVIAVLMNQSPLLLLSGLGALAAILMLVFKDTILSLVASVQLTSNDMLRVGDWIEMPQLDADGDVIDIALHTVKVQNFDKTITSIPTYRLISESFRNWRGMSQSGSRRIMRSLFLDQNSVRLLGDADCAKLRQFKLLRPYLDAKRAELEQFNAQLESEGEEAVNARHLTNVGTFRAYVIAYLRANPRIRDDMTLIVRQLEPGPNGLPLQVYCFASTVVWAEYEAIQADIFDHLLAVMPQFGLRIVQVPTGLDLRAVREPIPLPTPSEVTDAA
jgi:miniconductance mechanosensitive channel